MNSISFLPDIVCITCGSVIGHKYISYMDMLNDGYSSLEAFESLNVFSYCCRMRLSNPAVMTINHGNPIMRKKVVDTKDDITIKFCINIPGSFTSLTKAIDEDVFIRPACDISILRDKLQNIPSIYIEPIEKVTMLTALTESNVVSTSADNQEVNKILRIYNTH